LFDSLISSSNGSEEVLDISAGSLHLSTSQMTAAAENSYLYEDGDSAARNGDGEFIIAEEITPLNLTPRSVTTSFTFHSAQAPPSTPVTFHPKATTAATLPRMKEKGKAAPLHHVKQVKSDNIEAVISRRPLLTGVDIQVCMHEAHGGPAMTAYGSLNRINKKY
jgi:hypothetical protein